MAFRKQSLLISRGEMFPFSQLGKASESMLKLVPRACCDEAVSGDGSKSNFALSSRVSSCVERCDSHLCFSLFELLCEKKFHISHPGFCANHVPVVVFKELWG